MIEEGPQFASHEDSDIGAALRDLFVREGIEVLLGTEVRQVDGHSGDKVRVHLNSENDKRTIEGTDLLVATGRTPNTDGLGLELTGVQLKERGYIKVNDRLETTTAQCCATRSLLIRRRPRA